MKISAKPTSNNAPNGTAKTDNRQRICRNTAGQVTDGDKIWQVNSDETYMKATYKNQLLTGKTSIQLYFSGISSIFILGRG